MKKKLCFCLREFDPNIDGHGKYIYEMIIELSKIFDLIVIVEKGKNELIEGKTICMKSNNKFFLLIENFYTLLKLRMKGYKTFYSHYTIFSRINIGLITKVFGGKSYFWHCARIVDFMKNQKGFKKIFKIITEYLPFKFSAWLNTGLVTGNNTMKQYYHTQAKIPLSKIEVCPNWVDTERFEKAIPIKKEELNIDPSKKVILFVHRLSERKGARDLPKIIEKIMEEREDLVFLIIGDGPLLTYLQEKTDEKTTKIIGGIPNILIPRYLCIADIFIMPSLHEGFPRVILESMAAGVPYVATDVGGVKEISPEGYPLVVRKGNPRLFSEKIIDIIDNPKLAHKISEELKEHVEKYSLSSTLDQLRTILNS